jgi:hypothetical protein
MNPQPQLRALLADISNLTPDTSPYRVRAVAVRARRLGRADLLPAWCAPTTPAPPVAIPPSSPEEAQALLEAHDPTPVINAKASAACIPASVLREVYCREMASATPLPPNLTRVAAAHARVNTFVRLVQGDMSARDDDADLLSKLSY